jgi:predicted dehydrogenase
MEPIDLILLGCGLMGGRHLKGYAELERVRPGTLRLRAVCDPRSEAAERLAGEAEALLGYRPLCCGSAEEALKRQPRIVAADVATDPRSHAAVVTALLEAGIHVQVEKPLSVTAAPGREMVEVARRSGRILAVAENYRRDPMNRLLRHVVESGAIGEPQFVTQVYVSAGHRVVVSPWRHAWAQGGLALDVGVHYADMLEFLLGPADTVAAVGQKVRAEREWPDPGGEQSSVPVECDDLYAALLTFGSGAQGAWIMNFASAGQRQWQRTVYGSTGTVSGPADRSGEPVSLQRGSTVFVGDALLRELPTFRLNETEALFFGERPATCPREFQEMDRQLIAIETVDFLDAIREGGEPEVPGEAGLRSVALVMALLESVHAGRPVRVDDVLSGAVHHFQSWLAMQAD